MYLFVLSFLLLHLKETESALNGKHWAHCPVTLTLLRDLFLFASVLHHTYTFVLLPQTLIGSLPALGLWFTRASGTASYSWHGCAYSCPASSLAHGQLNLWLQRVRLEWAVELAFSEKTTVNCRDWKAWWAPWPHSEWTVTESRYAESGPSSAHSVLPKALFILQRLKNTQVFAIVFYIML